MFKVRYLFFTLAFFIYILSFSASLYQDNVFPSIFIAEAEPQSEASWQITDTFTLTPGWIDWTETRYNPKPDPWIEQGWWFEIYEQDFLISPSDIFLKTYETFNWTAVNNAFFGFEDFSDFQKNITDNPTWWLEWSGGLDTVSFGISINRTFIDAVLDGDVASIQLSTHVTHVPEYLISWSLGFEGFDLQSISLGKIDVYEYSAIYNSDNQSIHLHFSAPSTILQQQGDTFTATIQMAPWTQHTPSQSDMRVEIVMPASTELKMATPSDGVEIENNLARFTIHEGKSLPASFTVTSAPRQKTFLENFVDRFASAEGIAAIIGMTALLLGGIQGLRRLRRNRTYNRLIRLIVKLYEEYRSNPDTLEKEMDNLTEAIFRSFIDNHISDEHLEKMLNRRDDLLARARSAS